jgi:hypothetical protein
MYITKKLNFKQVMYNDEQQIILGLNDLFTKELSGQFFIFYSISMSITSYQTIKKG